MNWQIFLTISIIFISISALMQKKLLSNEYIHPLTFAATFQIVISGFIGLVVLFTGFHLPDLRTIWVNLALMPFLYMLGNIGKMKALKTIDASEFTVIFQASTLITVLLAIVLLGEGFGVTRFLGLALVVSAVLLVTLKDRIDFNFSKGELWALLAACSYGSAFANDAYILRSFDVWSYTFLAFLIPGLLTLLLAWKQKAEIRALFEKTNVTAFLFTAFLTSVSTIAMFTAYQVGRNMAQISALNQLTTIVIVILAAIFLKERKRLPTKLAAAVLSIIGVILLK